MKSYNKYFKRLRNAAPLMAVATMLMLSTSCERRELWVYQDRFKQVELDIDWRNYFRNQQLYPNTPDPDGMTVWFFPRDGRKSFRYTTTEVRHYETYLSAGQYDGLVIDYSPEEYGHQEFIGMDYANTAKVQATASSYQVSTIPELYGEPAYAHQLAKNEDGSYTIAWEPELIANDTVHMDVKSGKYDQYIPYKERDTYQSTLVKQLYNMEPLLIPWNMRIRIYIKGIYYLYNTEASLAGMADGYYLVDCKTSETPCLLKLDDWEVHVTGDNVGYIAKTFRTWGPMNFTNMDYDITQKGGVQELSDRTKDEVRVNLKFTLRDRKTVLYYHFDVGNLMRAYWNEYALRIDLEDGFDGQPVLPYVDPANGIGIGGIVVPWEDGVNSEVNM